MRIEFEKTIEEVSFHSPLADMARVTGEIERRRDPLTGRVTVLSSFLKDKAGVLFPDTDRALLTELATQTRPKCFFCPERVASVTPKYPEEWIPGGRIRRGECLLFPNLFPISAVHAVIAVGEKHHRDLDDFPPGLLADGLSCALELIERVAPKAPALTCYTLNGNYLFPGGASIVHPHFQLLGSRYPAAAVAELRTACDRFRSERGSDYFDALLETEGRAGERLIGSTGSATWIAPFAPTGLNEVIGVLPQIRSLKEMTPDRTRDLAEGLSKVLAGYHRSGCSTFNFSVFSDALDAKAPAFPVFLRVMCRQNVYPNHRTDDYFVQKLLGEEIAVSSPETLAARLREGF